MEDFEYVPETPVPVSPAGSSPIPLPTTNRKDGRI